MNERNFPLLYLHLLSRVNRIACCLFSFFDNKIYHPHSSQLFGEISIKARNSLYKPNVLSRPHCVSLLSQAIQRLSSYRNRYANKPQALHLSILFHCWLCIYLFVIFVCIALYLFICCSVCLISTRDLGVCLGK